MMFRKTTLLAWERITLHMHVKLCLVKMHHIFWYLCSLRVFGFVACPKTPVDTADSPKDLEKLTYQQGT